MTDYRSVMSLLLQDRSYRDIEAIAGCSHRTIAKAKKVCPDFHKLTLFCCLGFRFALVGRVRGWRL